MKKIVVALTIVGTLFAGSFAFAGKGNAMGMNISIPTETSK